MSRTKGWTWVLLPVLFSLFSCATYNTQISKYYSQVVGGNYEAADAAIDKIRKLQVNRNKLLYLLEKGKLAHLLHEYENSNRFFNEADSFIEDVRTSAGDVALSVLLNPMMSTYKGEDFEKFMIHYYKALNYLYLGLPDEAMVEARRISLQSYAQQDKTGNKQSRYSDDAFSLMLQGIIYEKNNDLNNAFIAYRNAVDVFLKGNGVYYNVTIPEQLQKDLLRTAYLNGFTDEQDRYEKLFNRKYAREVAGEGGELVLFWENGLAPVKEEQNFFFALNKDNAGNFFFSDNSGLFVIPFDVSSHNVNRNDLKIENLRSFRVAFPRYVEQPTRYHSATVSLNGDTYILEKTEDINAIAFATLKERFLKEAGVTLGRLLVKKMAEMAARPQSDSAKNKEVREAAALALQIFNFVSEKADTRNWQTLPHTIYYTRIPLKKGENKILLQANPGNASSELLVEGRGGIEVRNICTLR